MRKSTAILASTVVLLTMLTACEGPAGPAGPAGSAGVTGPAGPAGPVGPAGQDANENCTQCHTGDVSLFAKEVQWAKSNHGIGDALYDRTSCSVCHSHQGFIERLQTGEWVAAATIEDPVPINCRTCHQIHTTYTAADYAFTTPDEVALRVAGMTVDLGSSNLCATCHQSRLRDGMPVIDGDPLAMTSSHFGTHHGPQGDVVAGLAFYNFNATPEGQHTHGAQAGCPTCHMATGSEFNGGHTFNLNADGDDYVVGCESAGCHGEVDDFEHFGLQAEVQALIDELGVLLDAAGVAHYDVDDEEWHPVTDVVFPANHVAAWYNFIGMIEDRSLGIHNPTYVKGILEGTIEAMQ